MEIKPKTIPATLRLPVLKGLAVVKQGAVNNQDGKHGK
jgi:hypothetical protein